MHSDGGQKSEWTAAVVTGVGTVWSPLAGQPATQLCENCPWEVRGCKLNLPAQLSQCQSSPVLPSRGETERGGLKGDPSQPALPVQTIRGTHMRLCTEPNQGHQWRGRPQAARRAGLPWPGLPARWGCCMCRGGGDGVRWVGNHRARNQGLPVQGSRVVNRAVRFSLWEKNKIITSCKLIMHIFVVIFLCRT